MKTIWFCAASLTLALAASAQTSTNTSPPGPAVIDRGPFWRTWGSTTRVTDDLTGAVTEEAHQYTELGDGMHYFENGQWAESQSMIELSPTGAQAVRGQHKAQGDTGDPVMVRDTINGTIYLLGNPSRESGYQGFRLWKSTDNGQSFSLVNTNVPAGFRQADKPMIAVNNFTNLSNSTNVYAAGRALSGNLGGVFIARSSDAGVTWTNTNFFATTNYDSIGADIAIRPDGTVYVFYLAYGYNTNSGAFTNWLQYNWLPLGQSNWHAGSITAHSDSTNLYSTNVIASGNLKRSNSADERDFFEDNGLPRVAVNSSNGHIYLVFADLPSGGSTTDRGDIWINEGVPNADGSLSWAVNGARKLNNDRTSTDQFIPSVVVNPAGNEVFVGYYSRQSDPSNNALIKAYGARANIANGLPSATFDTFPISSVAFTNLFAGTTNSTPSADPWLFDWVWSQGGVCMDTNARVVDCSSTNMAFTTSSTYANFTADDYTWSAADSSYFYFAWRDCSDLCTNTWSGNSYTRPDANIRFARIRP